MVRAISSNAIQKKASCLPTGKSFGIRATFQPWSEVS